MIANGFQGVTCLKPYGGLDDGPAILNKLEQVLLTSFLFAKVRYVAD
jgi:hypothetical protein